ncbi:TetR/AcrR family transcriptional regulator [Streptomyces qinzhouensis]|uniref:TetR/AcrR family transcriptional regulator n=1 Tax=Streptomyces qinzhouensis TaxID=2599401 RepID=A0A5B8J1U9_9ACTN|nr:TetR/AcrR family transcriptional regulator [Streptomyces qinzhouensis]QDY75735.1 TetR/AcrR family transcriptional regulator [Streptomyces qinzhouensis]
MKRPLTTGPAGAGPAGAGSAATRAELIADTALRLLAERGMRGLTHRAVDEVAGLPQGSTSNGARTRLALLELAVRRLAEREEAVLGLPGFPGPGSGPEAFAEAMALAVHRYLTRHRPLVVARYELALEATRRPELRAVYDAAGSRLRAPLIALMTAAGSLAPERHALSLIAWADGLMFTCAAGSYHDAIPRPEDLRTGFGELLHGMLAPGEPAPESPTAP